MLIIKRTIRCSHWFILQSVMISSWIFCNVNSRFAVKFDIMSKKSCPICIVCNCSQNKILLEVKYKSSVFKHTIPTSRSVLFFLLCIFFLAITKPELFLSRQDNPCSVHSFPCYTLLLSFLWTISFNPSTNNPHSKAWVYSEWRMLIRVFF